MKLVGSKIILGVLLVPKKRVFQGPVNYVMSISMSIRLLIYIL